MSNKVYFLLSAFLLIVLAGTAQQNDNSPYSRYGIGDISDNNFNHTRQMSGLGSSYIDGYHINIVNPASYSFLNATALSLIHISGVPSAQIKVSMTGGNINRNGDGTYTVQPTGAQGTKAVVTVSAPVSYTHLDVYKRQVMWYFD